MRRTGYTWGMITTVQQYRSIAGLRDDSQDERIAALIPLVEDDYLAIRGRAFDTGPDGETIYPPGAALTAAEMIGYRLATLDGGVGVSSETIGDWSVAMTGDLLCGYPRSTVQRIKRYARMK